MCAAACAALAPPPRLRIMCRCSPPPPPLSSSSLPSTSSSSRSTSRAICATAGAQHAAGEHQWGGAVGKGLELSPSGPCAHSGAGATQASGGTVQVRLRAAERRFDERAHLLQARGCSAAPEPTLSPVDAHGASSDLDVSMAIQELHQHARSWVASITSSRPSAGAPACAAAARRVLGDRVRGTKSGSAASKQMYKPIRGQWASGAQRGRLSG